MKEGLRKIAGDDILESLGNTAAGRGNPTVEVQDRRVDALFALETEVAIGDLYSDGNEDGAAGYAEEIRAVINVNLVVNDADGDDFREILEVFWRTLNAEVAVETLELIHACGKTA